MVTSPIAQAYRAWREAATAAHAAEVRYCLAVAEDRPCPDHDSAVELRARATCQLQELLAQAQFKAADRNFSRPMTLATTSAHRLHDDHSWTSLTTP